jgi:hypothetical protein
MSRRLIAALSAVCLAALSLTAVALASSGGGSSSKDKRSSSTADKQHGKRTAHARNGGIVRGGHAPGGFFGGPLIGASLDSLAKRLGVSSADLQTAVKAVMQEQADKRLTAAGLTAEEIAAVKACRDTARKHGFKKRDGAAVPPAACATDALKSAQTKLQAARKTAAKPDLTALKAELAASLATKLAKTPDEVLAAVRAELDARLTQAVTAGWLTQKGHDLALACFDTPATCDTKALRAEVKFFHGGDRRGKHHGHGHRKGGAKPSSTTPGSTTAPGSTTTPGSGLMHPGGQATTPAAPLRS